MKFEIKTVAIIALMSPIFGHSAVLTVSGEDRMSEAQTVTTTAVRNADNGYELAIRGATLNCDVPKAVAEAAGYSLGDLQSLIASSRDEVSIACYGPRGSAYKGWAKEILVQTTSRKPVR